MSYASRVCRVSVVAALVSVAACDSPSKPPDPPVATSLVFDAQPNDAVAGATISPAVRVRVLDASGNVFTGPVTVTIALANAGAATLLGITTATTANGVATFDNVATSRPGTYALSATAPGLTAATSRSFVVNAAETARYCPGEAGSSAAFNAFADAIASVTAGGTILICDGTHELGGTGIGRAVTIRPEHEGKVTVTNTTNPVAFFVTGIAAGTVRISGLTFDVSGAAGVLVDQSYDKVVVEASTFRAQPNATTAVEVRASKGPSTDALVTVRGNTASGFRQTFAARVGAKADVVDNTIDASVGSAVFFEAETRGVIQRNRMTGCGTSSCIQASPQAAGSVEILDNEMTTDVSRGTSFGIIARGRVTVRGNRVIGTGGAGLQQPLALDAFAIRGSGIAVEGVAGTAPIIEGNEIKNARHGVELVSTTPAGSTVRNNRVSQVLYGFLANEVGAADRFERNDVAEYMGATNAGMVVAAGASFKCNWWGRGVGPFPPIGNARPPESTWQPYSRVPIANRPEVTCDPAGPPLPTRWCPQEAAAGNAWGSFVEAVGLTPVGSTVVVCDGTHPLTTVLSKSVTIAGEHPLGATLVPEVGQSLILIGEGETGKIVFRGLRFKAPAPAIQISARNDVMIERNRFEMGDAAAIAVWVYNGASNVVIRDNEFVGGTNGVHVNAGGAVQILDNKFSGQRDGAAVDLLNGPGPYVVRGNQVSRCARLCIKSMYADVEIVENRIEGRVADFTQQAIFTYNGIVTVSRNTIDSPDPIPADRTFTGHYAFRDAAIAIDGDATGTQRARVDGNTIRHAYIGIFAWGATAITGQDNVVTLTNHPLEIRHVGPTFHRNDFTNYLAPVIAGAMLPDGSLSCNYWEGGTAPSVHPDFLPVVQPFSSVPIAGKAEVSCP